MLSNQKNLRDKTKHMHKNVLYKSSKSSLQGFLGNALVNKPDSCDILVYVV